VLIGGRGERKTLRLVADYADAWNMGAGLSDDGLAEFRHRVDVLRGHCERAGRSIDSIEKTVLLTLFLSREPQSRGAWITPEEAIERLGRLREAGMDQAIVNLPHVDRPETLDRLAESVLPAVAKM
jgi:alkanesulfonate monooxygenase